MTKQKIEITENATYLVESNTYTTANIYAPDGVTIKESLTFRALQGKSITFTSGDYFEYDPDILKIVFNNLGGSGSGGGGGVTSVDGQTGAVTLGSTYIKLDGSSPMTGSLDAGSNTINNVTDPTTDQQVATKKYVDDKVAAGFRSSNKNSISEADVKKLIKDAIAKLNTK